MTEPLRLPDNDPDLRRYSFLVGDPLRSDADEAWMAEFRARLQREGYADPGWVPVPRPLRLTVEQVLAILPSLEREPSYPLTVTEALNVAARESELTTPQRMAAFLAQVAHESGEFRWLMEHAHRKPVAGCRLCPEPWDVAPRPPWPVIHEAGAQYEGRADLGNTEPGDGVRYKGRGPLQLTGRANYRAAGKALGEPLEQQPELAARLDVGMRVAAWYWRERAINSRADVSDFVGVTKRINGGTNGLEQRRAYYERALRVLEGR